MIKFIKKMIVKIKGFFSGLWRKTKVKVEKPIKYKLVVGAEDISTIEITYKDKK